MHIYVCISLALSISLSMSLSLSVFISIYLSLSLSHRLAIMHSELVASTLRVMQQLADHLKHATEVSTDHETRKSHAQASHMHVAAVGPGFRGMRGYRLGGDINWEEEKEESGTKTQLAKHK